MYFVDGELNIYFCEYLFPFPGFLFVYNPLKSNIVYWHYPVVFHVNKLHDESSGPDISWLSQYKTFGGLSAAAIIVKMELVSKMYVKKILLT